MKKLLLVFLLLLPLGARAQNVYVFDSVENAQAQDAIIFAGDTLAHNVRVAALYFHKANSAFTMVIADAPAQPFQGIRAISIPNMSAGARTGKIDSIAFTTVQLLDGLGDTIASSAYYFHLASNKAFTIWGDSGPFFPFLAPQTIVGYIK